MDRRTFLAGGALGATAAQASLREHNWRGFDWGGRPAMPDRLYQGPFPQYGAGAVIPGSEVVMVTTPSRDVVSNYGMGLTVYVSGDTGPPRISGQTLAQSIEDLVALPFVQKVYLRPNWREVQHRRGRLDFPDWWHITFDAARRHKKRVGFRIMLENPDFAEPGMPAFLMEKVPYLRLKGTWKGDPKEVRHRKLHAMPQYDHPAYQAAFEELNALLASDLNGHADIEYMDTMMFGFWGEGHTWPFEGNVFLNDAVAEQTWLRMLAVQRKHWNRTPLVTNTQPDFNRVGNAAMLEQTVRGGDWIRSDTIFIENTQIEALSNRPPWCAAVSEVGMTRGDPDVIDLDEGVTLNERIIAHVLAVGANYWSVWNWHDEAAAHVLSYYDRFPAPIEEAARRIGYRVYPSFIWAFDQGGTAGLVIGLANDGVAAPPGIVRLTVATPAGEALSSGSLDAGLPTPTGIQQALMKLPAGTQWEGLCLHASLLVKGVEHPLRWACRQQLREDGSLVLRRNVRT